MIKTLTLSMGAFLVLLGLALPAAPGICQTNILPNGGFETDSNSDGVADGWVAQPSHFSRQTLQDVQSYIDNLGSYRTLLAGTGIKAADGTVLWAKSGGVWPANMLTFGGHNWGAYEQSYIPEVNWYNTLRSETIPNYSRFGKLPVLTDVALGDCTLMLSQQYPLTQVVSDPMPIKPDTGYRLTFRVRTVGGGEWWYGPQVLDGSCNPESVPLSPQDSKHYNDNNVINSIPSTIWWCSGIAQRGWAKMELPFRTGASCSSIRIRLPYHDRDAEGRQKMDNVNYRVFYDDLRIVEDPSVRGAGPTNEGVSDKPELKWSAEAVARGFVTAPRPTLPLTYDGYMSSSDEADAPIRLSLAAGETDSSVVFVRSLSKEDAILRADPSHLASKNGYGLLGAYGARFITVRAAEMTTRFLNAKRYVIVPKVLLNSSDLSVRAGGTGQFWVTVTVPPGTPAGEYVGKLTVTRTKPAGGEPSSRQVSVPIVLTVRDIALEQADAAFFVWSDTSPVEGTMGPASALPGAEEIYLADQRRHGMNTAATYSYAERKDEAGDFRISFNELDAMVANVQRAGLCSSHPLIILTWRDGGTGGEFGELAGGAKSVMAISEHGKKSGWPDVLFTVLDEPNGDVRSARVAQVIKNEYAQPRKKGVRTVTAGGYPGAFTRPMNEKGDTLGDLFDVWIEGNYANDWPELHKEAARKKAELWMYNCWTTGAGYLQERFYSGLWTWRTGAKGNGAWSYGWYVRINDSGMPESLMAWEGRAAGVNDYRYLQTLEHTVAACSGKPKAAESIKDARAFLGNLRGRIPLTAYENRPGAIPQEQWAELDAWNPVPEIGPDDYGSIRDECARHIAAIRKACGK